MPRQSHPQSVLTLLLQVSLPRRACLHGGEPNGRAGRVAGRARRHNNDSVAAQFEAEAIKAEKQARVIHDVLAGKSLEATTE